LVLLRHHQPYQQPQQQLLQQVQVPLLQQQLQALLSQQVLHLHQYLRLYHWLFWL